MRQALSVYEVGLQHIETLVENSSQCEFPFYKGRIRRFSMEAIMQLGEAGQLWWKEICWQHGFSTDEAQQALQAKEGFWISSSTHQLCRHGQWLEVADFRGSLPILKTEAIPHTHHFRPSRDPYSATIDATAVKGQLTLRYVEIGDRFSPYGMSQGSKLVSDYLTDRHRSRIEKQYAMVVCDAQGIVWLVGETIAHRVAIQENTPSVLRLTLGNTEQLEEQ